MNPENEPLTNQQLWDCVIGVNNSKSRMREIFADGGRTAIDVHIDHEIAKAREEGRLLDPRHDEEIYSVLYWMWCVVKNHNV